MPYKQITCFLLLACNTFIANAKVSFVTTDLQTEQISATLYIPKQSGKMSAVIVLGGSSGHRNTVYPELLAAHGIVAMSLAYFRSQGLPNTLDEIPIETVSDALDYLQNHPQVNTNNLGILGVSRGSELAFLSATNDPRITAVAGIVPSSVAWHGQISPHAWTIKGKPLPSVTFPRQSEESIYERSTAALTQNSASYAQFQFEKINGSLLLISAKNDHIWPSSLMANKIMTYLKQHNFTHSTYHLSVNDNHFIDQKTRDGYAQLLVDHFR
ncbi:acyl-CoA thioester hydrolase/BAAT C-terminal domain-containing protein [Paraglaciecola marina]|uniref:acyl-CoA thioester hydrolase/BAAT C-terminal domain-containing protein n=1 Tax=Paraglaciecola marina TaxID=2500157 RepID=UPI0010609DBD|nr:acyl-CoA thioester hydrolase/BAAT C-terminal domain-containing protein [Paraglaciecola marina]